MQCISKFTNQYKLLSAELFFFPPNSARYVPPFYPHESRFNVLFRPPVPCAPAHPQTLHDCSSNVIVYSWQTTNNTLYYVATAVDGTGKVTECRTPDNTCYFTNTGCGQHYKYTVYAVSPDCNTEVSQPEFVRTCE